MARPSTAPVAGVRRAVVALGSAALLAAVVVSSFAAATPDGLEATAESFGFADAARDHAFAGMPLADYGEVGGIFVGAAGFVGVALVVALTAGLLAAGLRATTRRGEATAVARGPHRPPDRRRTAAGPPPDCRRTAGPHRSAEVEPWSAEVEPWSAEVEPWSAEVEPWSRGVEPWSDIG